MPSLHKYNALRFVYRRQRKCSAARRPFRQANRNALSDRDLRKRLIASAATNVSADVISLIFDVAAVVSLRILFQTCAQQKSLHFCLLQTQLTQGFDVGQVRLKVGSLCREQREEVDFARLVG